MTPVARLGALALLLFSSGCAGAAVHATTLGRYHGVDSRTLFARARAAVEETGHELEWSDEGGARLAVRSEWGHRGAHATFLLRVEPDGWLVAQLVDHEGVLAESAPRPVAEEYHRLLVTVRRALERPALVREIGPPHAGVQTPTGHVNPSWGRRPQWALVVPGLFAFGAGYAGALWLGTEIGEGADGCRRTYGDLHAIPLAGPALAVGEGWGCREVSPFVFVLDFIAFFTQLAGAALVTIGALHGVAVPEHEGPLDIELVPWAGPTSAGASITGSF